MPERISEERARQILARVHDVPRGDLTIHRYDWGGGRISTEEPRALIADLYDPGTREFVAHARDDVLDLLATLTTLTQAITAALAPFVEHVAATPLDLQCECLGCQMGRAIETVLETP